MKKLMKVLTVAVTMCVCLTPVFAKPSISHNGTISTNEILIDGKKVDATKVTAGFKSDFSTTVVKKEVVEAIQQLNTDPKKLVEALKATNIDIQGLDETKLEQLEVLTQVQDLTLIDKTTGEPMKDVKNVTVTWEVPNLVKGLGDIRVLHFSTVRNVWEILTPSEIDYATNSITQFFKDLSPVAVVYVPSAGGDTTGSKTDKPQTADTNMILPIAAVCVLSGALVFVLLRKKHEN
ncbi:LPXTG cell wall anchor domain-containing protein [Candidatus Stoquefichus massiliensis]|uniref:LPXTG cell wall anchor domain-containing protein n=1 Tax=Candidatus Stoquefichus massiliensis TaxID=1470350 RepID=UPI0004B469AA|nr:LPXTG cell wall anchor domain-containing protein [Candidatus Stoquefichus massiliensis]